VTDVELRDLRARLRATRWPEPETDPSQGVALADLQELCRYWAQAYDWRACEERLSAVGQYRTAARPAKTGDHSCQRPSGRRVRLLRTAAHTPADDWLLAHRLS